MGKPAGNKSWPAQSDPRSAILLVLVVLLVLVIALVLVVALVLIVTLILIAHFFTS